MTTARDSGTVQYMAPERFNIDGTTLRQTAAADVYSYACLCYAVSPKNHSHVTVDLSAPASHRSSSIWLHSIRLRRHDRGHPWGTPRKATGDWAVAFAAHLRRPVGFDRPMLGEQTRRSSSDGHGAVSAREDAPDVALVIARAGQRFASGRHPTSHWHFSTTGQKSRATCW